ncbi:ChaN family lipoprotein [Azomonas macrocytogenes]|uniref:Putative iron-regulated protein n=1 Tax=Azomonas macrocytogenes TaxID=69962 RepID=A0A839T6R7_AZOMA|nr:ChaN family lipoprotein [Azomonas macrocytogenes]MBB3105132.1 putative iron-regulated protein [Azomonas macrocytogenes]
MRIVLFVLAILLTACHSLPPLPPWQSPGQREHENVGQIIDLHTGAVLAPAQLIDRLAASSRVLVGERHDNPDHHALQLWLLQALAEQRGQGSVLLEMLTPDQQQRVRQVQAAYARGNPPADLKKALGWQPGWDWDLYGPLVSYLLRQPYPVLAANLDRSEIASVYRLVEPLKGQLSSAPAVQEKLMARIREAHCNLLPENQLPAMLAIQQQRDRRIAERLLAAPGPALLLAGAYHVRRDLGVPLHLQDLGGKDAVVLMLAEAGSKVQAAQADFVWYTAAMPQQREPCERLKERIR